MQTTYIFNCFHTHRLVAKLIERVSSLKYSSYSVTVIVFYIYIDSRLPFKTFVRHFLTMECSRCLKTGHPKTKFVWISDIGLKSRCFKIEIGQVLFSDIYCIFNQVQYCEQINTIVWCKKDIKRCPPLVCFKILFNTYSRMSKLERPETGKCQNWN